MDTNNNKANEGIEDCHRLDGHEEPLKGHTTASNKTENWEVYHKMWLDEKEDHHQTKLQHKHDLEQLAGAKDEIRAWRQQHNLTLDANTRNQIYSPDGSETGFLKQEIHQIMGRYSGLTMAQILGVLDMVKLELFDTYKEQSI